MGSKRIARACIAAAAACAVLVGLGDGASGAVLAPNASCGQVVSADLTLNSDLVGCPGYGLSIVGSNITLDLNGHTVSGTGGDTGILAGDDSSSFITVENGTVSGFAFGVGSGLALDNHVTLRNLDVTGNNSGGISLNSRLNIVEDSWIAGNGGDGIVAEVFADNNSFQRNVIFGNSGYGIFARNATAEVTGNIVNNNGRDGISLLEEFDLGSSYLIAGNTAFDNNGLGISACDNLFGVGPCAPGMVDGGGNAAWGNADSRQCLNVVCAAATSLLGVTEIEPGIDTNTAGQAEAFQTKAGASGTATHLSIYLDPSSTATGLVAGIYAGNGAHPGALLGQAAAAGRPIAGAWNTITLPAVGLSAGTRYWIAILTPVGAGTIRFRDLCCGYNGDMRSETSKQTTLTTLPPSWKKGPRSSDSPVSAWAG